MGPARHVSRGSRRCSTSSLRARRPGRSTTLCCGLRESTTTLRGRAKWVFCQVHWGSNYCVLPVRQRLGVDFWRVCDILKHSIDKQKCCILWKPMSSLFICHLVSVALDKYLVIIFVKPSVTYFQISYNVSYCIMCIYLSVCLNESSFFLSCCCVKQFFIMCPLYVVDN